jgi:cytochrome P450
MSNSAQAASRSTADIDVSTPRGELFARVLDPESRANPYPLYAALRSEPVSRQDDGTWVVSGFDEINTLLHDPRVSSDMRNAGRPLITKAEPPLILLDPPNHDRLRAAVMGRFTPALVESLRQEVRDLVDRLVDAVGSRTQLDLVDEIAYPLPVSVICTLLAIPPQDEAKFHAWADAVAQALDLDPSTPKEQLEAIAHAVGELGHYFEGLIAERIERPGNDLISGLIVGSDRGEPLSGEELVTTVRLLLIAGHETTVNLITNGMLTLLRHPDLLERFRGEPDLVVPMVEELVRYEPSVQFRYRATLADIEIAGTTIPRGSVVVLLLAAGSRDPGHFTDPDHFVPDRTPNEHFGFGGGIHYCIGAPLARMEVQVVLPELIRRFENPRLVMDPPPYRPTAALRGPLHLRIDVDGIRA